MDRIKIHYTVHAIKDTDNLVFVRCGKVVDDVHGTKDKRRITCKACQRIVNKKTSLL